MVLFLNYFGGNGLNAVVHMCVFGVFIGAGVGLTYSTNPKLIPFEKT